MRKCSTIKNRFRWVGNGFGYFFWTGFQLCALLHLKYDFQYDALDSVCNNFALFLTFFCCSSSFSFSWIPEGVRCSDSYTSEQIVVAFILQFVGNVVVCASFQCKRRIYHLNFTESLTTQSGRIFHFGIPFRVKKQTFIKLASHPKRNDVDKMRYRKKIHPHTQENHANNAHCVVNKSRGAENERASSIQTTIQFCINITVNVRICMSVSGKNKHSIRMHKLWLTIHINIVKCLHRFSAVFDAIHSRTRCFPFIKCISFRLFCLSWYLLFAFLFSLSLFLSRDILLKLLLCLWHLFIASNMIWVHGFLCSSFIHSLTHSFIVFFPFA